ncbi:hypothetical protein CL616_01630 [archaeon]|nr:hypothetical protein [archaeon]|tara:strand:+ start:734 stop:1126 length:393 start_codon:yes stop_codon:yes gene_type:complete
MRKEEVESLKKTIIDIHKFIIYNYGGEQGIRDEGGLYYFTYRLISHLYKTKDPFEIGAFVLKDLAQNHYFIDGNKRIAYMTTIFILYIKGHFLGLKYKDVVNFITQIADAKIRLYKIKKWLEEEAKIIKR